MNDKEQRELEELAEKFILGYKPLSRYQKVLIDLIGRIDVELDQQTKDRPRLLRLRDEISKRIEEKPEVF